MKTTVTLALVNWNSRITDRETAIVCYLCGWVCIPMFWGKWVALLQRPRNNCLTDFCSFGISFKIVVMQYSTSSDLILILSSCSSVKCGTSLRSKLSIGISYLCHITQALWKNSQSNIFRY